MEQIQVKIILILYHKEHYNIGPLPQGDYTIIYQAHYYTITKCNNPKCNNPPIKCPDWHT